MKKLLLSISMLVATLATNAQFVIWDASAGTGFTGAGTAFVFSPGVNSFTVDTASSAPYLISFSGVAPSTCGTGTDGCYYINGFGNGSYSSGGSPQDFGYTATNFSTDKFFMNVKTTGTKIKVQFSTFTSGVQDADLYGYEFDLSANTGTAFTTEQILMSSFSKIVSNNPDNANFLTSTIAQRIGKIEIVFVKTANSGAGAASADLGNMSIGSAQITATQNASASIASSKLYPNPVSDMAKVELNLKAASTVKVTLSDVMGKEVMTIAEGTFSDITKEFSVANLNKGIYTVNYTINGEAAKAELLMVK